MGGGGGATRVGNSTCAFVPKRHPMDAGSRQPLNRSHTPRHPGCSAVRDRLHALWCALLTRAICGGATAPRLLRWWCWWWWCSGALVHTQAGRGRGHETACLCPPTTTTATTTTTEDDDDNNHDASHPPCSPHGAILGQGAPPACLPQLLLHGRPPDAPGRRRAVLCERCG